MAGGVILWLLALAALACWWGPWHSQGRRALWLAALLCLPYALLSFEYIPRYWNPRLLGWFGFASIEDLLFSSATGLLGWFAAAWPLRARLHHAFMEQPDGVPVALDWRSLFRRYLPLSAAGIGLGYAIRYGIPGTPVMTSTLCGMAASGVFLLWRQPRLWPLAGNGALAFALGYAMLVKLMFTVWPGFMDAWGIAEQPHVWLWGIPLYELLWAAGFGAVWPLTVAWCLGTRYSQGPAVAKLALHS
jgi:hypothetical protein